MPQIQRVPGALVGTGPNFPFGSPQSVLEGHASPITRAGGRIPGSWTETEPYQHFIDIMLPNPPEHGAGIFAGASELVDIEQGREDNYR